MLPAALLFLAKLFLVLLALGGLVLIPFGVPGNLFIAALALLGPLLGLSWPDFWLIAGAAALAELLEFLTSLGVAKTTGASKVGLWGALLGGIAGAILLVPVLPPLGILFGGAAGSFAGAALFEFQFARRGSRTSLRVGAGAFFGTLLGRMAKIWLGVFQVVWLALSLW